VRKSLVVAVAQPLLTAHDVEANVAVHAQTVHAAGARVVVFPELSLTGYELDAVPMSETDPRLAPLVEACAETGTIALAGAPLQGGPYIAMLAVDGSGVSVAYRKVWIDPSEAHVYVSGGKPEVLDVDGWRLGLGICRDTGIVQHAEDTAALGIDAYVAGTVKSAEEAALQDERARRVATDHHVWVAVASFAGSTGGGFSRAAGRSSIRSSDGVVVTQAGPETGAIAHATLTDHEADHQHRPRTH
jgi:predicted amidohydrolase